MLAAPLPVVAPRHNEAITCISQVYCHCYASVHLVFLHAPLIDGNMEDLMSDEIILQYQVVQLQRSALRLERFSGRRLVDHRQAQMV